MQFFFFIKNIKLTSQVCVILISKLNDNKFTDSPPPACSPEDFAPAVTGGEAGGAAKEGCMYGTGLADTGGKLL